MMRPWNSCGMSLLVWEFCPHVFPLPFPLLPYCSMPQQPPHLGRCFSHNLFVLSSVVSQSAEDPYHQSHLILILQWKPGVFTISAIPSDVQHSKAFQKPLEHCELCILAQFFVIACQGIKQCLGTLSPKNDKMSQDYAQDCAHPSNPWFIAWVQLTASCWSYLAGWVWSVPGELDMHLLPCFWDEFSVGHW